MPSKLTFVSAGALIAFSPAAFGQETVPTTTTTQSTTTQTEPATAPTTPTTTQTTTTQPTTTPEGQPATTTQTTTTATQPTTTPEGDPATTTTQTTTTETQVTAATADDVKAGVSVYDQAGALVGKADPVKDDGVVVNTGEARAEIPLTSFGKNAKGLVISVTKAELEAKAKPKD